MDIYARNILDHYQRPRHRGALAAADASFHELNRSCGDDFKVYLKLKDGLIEAISFEGQGCAISTATASILSEFFLGKTPADILAMNQESLQQLLGIEISFRRQKCALIGLRALQGAVASLPLV
jgi:nitrogen fixation NifU-like protein